ncbi:hypothetical protein KIPB_010464 [Kipferlia bialata]|uniref:Uncharacterized protein n=1 Tax=Kipferlia bialata TaxID=797122 RepID=A0A9K3GMK1_9EUKA|nr:hypothetical protein KIPB_010464 [Kipferlia bialata]|eukprot:g10464.t1
MGDLLGVFNLDSGGDQFSIGKRTFGSSFDKDEGGSDKKKRPVVVSDEFCFPDTATLSEELDLTDLEASLPTAVPIPQPESDRDDLPVDQRKTIKHTVVFPPSDITFTPREACP